MSGEVRSTSVGETRDALCIPGDSLLRAGEDPPLAAHLVTPRAFYTHHGIYAGNGRVIHYAGLASGFCRGPVEDTSLEYFAHGHEIRVRHDARCFELEEIVERARSRLGESCYHLLTNNCEHFCAWALRGERQSRQVERLSAIPRAMAVALWTPYERIAGTIVQFSQWLATGVLLRASVAIEAHRRLTTSL